MRSSAFSATLVRALLCTVVCAMTPACTAFDDYLPGTPFTPDQPEGAVTLEGTIQADAVPEGSVVCAAGGTMLWGTVRNTGDVDVDEVTIEIDVFGPAGEFLGTYGGDVFNGETAPPVGSDAPAVALTNLVVDQTGFFEVCAAVPVGSVSRTEYRTFFIVLETSETL